MKWMQPNKKKRKMFTNDAKLNYKINQSLSKFRVLELLIATAMSIDCRLLPCLKYEKVTDEIKIIITQY